MEPEGGGGGGDGGSDICGNRRQWQQPQRSGPLDRPSSHQHSLRPILLIVLVLSAFILRWLWNKVLVPHITVVKPLVTLFDAFLMSIAISVIRGY
jgi:hypothetical protein